MKTPWVKAQRSRGYANFESNLVCYSRTDSTNNILYLKILGNDLFSNADVQSPELLVRSLIRLPIVMDCISEIGVEHRTIDDYTEDVKLHTGGISVGLETIIDYKGSDRDLIVILDNQKFSILPTISTHGLSQNVPRLLDLIDETLRIPNFSDKLRLKNLILSSSSSGITSIANSGHSYAILYASAPFSPGLVFFLVYSYV